MAIPIRCGWVVNFIVALRLNRSRTTKERLAFIIAFLIKWWRHTISIASGRQGLLFSLKEVWAHKRVATYREGRGRLRLWRTFFYRYPVTQQATQQVRGGRSCTPFLKHEQHATWLATVKVIVAMSLWQYPAVWFLPEISIAPLLLYFWRLFIGWSSLFPWNNGGMLSLERSAIIDVSKAPLDNLEIVTIDAIDNYITRYSSGWNVAGY